MPDGSGQNHTTVTERDGSFALSGLPVGDYSMFASQSASRRADARTQVQARTGEIGVRIVLQRAGSITGRVVASSQNPVTAFDIRLDFMPVPYSSPTGAFRIEGVTPGDHELVIQARGQPPKTIPVQVHPSETTDLGTVVLDQGRRVSGRVVGAHGEAAVRADVLIGREKLGIGP